MTSMTETPEHGCLLRGYHGQREKAELYKATVCEKRWEEKFASTLLYTLLLSPKTPRVRSLLEP